MEVKEEESSHFIEVRKEDLGGEDVASSSGAFGCSLHLCDCPFGHHFVARRFQHLVFVARCLFFEPRFTSMPTVHHHRVHLSPLHHYHHHDLLVPVS